MKLTVKKGKSDFTPSIWPLPRFSKEIYFEFSLDENCWYNSLGEDNYDFNKAFGVFRYFDFAKNKNALMLAWRPKLDQEFYFEFVPYENKNANIANEDKLKVFKAKEKVNGCFKLTDTWEMYIQTPDGDVLWYKSSLTASLYGLIDSWFGGTSKSPQDMSCNLIYVM